MTGLSDVAAQAGTSQPPVASHLVADVQGVGKRGPGRDEPILHDVSFGLAASELVCLRGPSGSGKTTLLAIVGGMLAPSRGEVWFDGESITRLKYAHRAEIRRRKVGFVFQDFQLIDDMSVLENVLLPKVPDGVGAAQIEHARALLARLGVQAQASQPARSLSGGERQRVAYARALVGDPKLLLLDEPSAHLDDARTASLVAELATFAQEGRAILVATHDVRMWSHAAVHRTLHLEQGRLQAPEDAAAAAEVPA